MPCYKPNIALIDRAPELMGQKASIKQFINTNSRKFTRYEFYERQNEIFRELGSNMEYVKIPCGDCSGCQETYSKAWAIRCIKEAEEYKDNYFITLTYDDEHLPCDDEIVDKRTGVIYEVPNFGQGFLQENDFTKFIKDLRRYYEYNYGHTGIRFFGCGEYGGTTRRPHYHAIIYNLPLKEEDTKVYKLTKDKNVLYTNTVLEKIWGKGFVTIGEVNFDTCAYVARYVMKKSGPRKKREDYFEAGETPEFIRMSRRPGIGKAYFDKNKDKIYLNDEVIIFNGEKVTAAKPPAYYDRLYDMTNADVLKMKKLRRKEIAENNNRIKNNTSSYTEKERLQIEERTKNAKWGTLKRSNID